MASAAVQFGIFNDFKGNEILFFLTCDKLQQMEILLVKPKNKEELEFLTDFFERTNIKSELHEDAVLIEKKAKKSRKEKILDSIEKGYREALLHSEGKLKLKTAKELLDEL